MLAQIKQECHGRWSGILTSLGMDEKVFNGRHQPCVFCGGRDRARWDRSKELYFCGQCGSRSPISLAIEFTGMSFKETMRAIRPNIMSSELKISSQIDTQAAEEKIKRVHAGLKRITPDSVVALYLAKRGITVLPDQDCYQHDNLAYYEDGVLLGSYPAMVSVIRTSDGNVATYHRTYLTHGGERADVPQHRKLMTPMNPISGGAIRLFKCQSSVIGIAEGIETAISVSALDGMECWAAGSSSQLEKVVFPPHIKTVWIYEDSEPSFVGRRAASELACRLVRGGIEVKIVTPTPAGSITSHALKYDFNDYLILKSNN